MTVLPFCAALVMSAGPACPTSAAHDLVFLSPRGPVLLRLHVYRDGQPLRERFQALMDEVFAGLDRDRDGRVSPKEAELAPTFGLQRPLVVPPGGLTRAAFEPAYLDRGLAMLSLRRVVGRSVRQRVP